MVVPVYNGLADLPHCIRALQASTPGEPWTLVVVDDGSTDGSGDWAVAEGLEVRRVDGGPKGPAAARNLGAQGADGDVLVFVDADVCVAPDVLARFATLFLEQEDLGAAFGTYDDRPEHPDFLSQYRNLYHRYVHLRGAGPAETFWAGCGAVRRGAFEAVGGFNHHRYRRPQVEDIELGYRIREDGWRIELDTTIECRHLKAWTLAGIVRTDLFDRGIPWMRLLLERAGPPSLNVGRGERARTLAVGLAIVLLPAAALAGRPELLLVSIGMLLCVVLANADLFRWLATRRGPGFAVRSVPMNLLYYGTSCLAAGVGVVQHIRGLLGSRRA